MYLFRCSKMDAVDLIDDIAQKITIDHAVDSTPENRSNNIPSVTAISTPKVPQISKQTRAACSIWYYSFIIIDKRNEFIPCYAVLFRCPVPPSVRRLYSSLILPSRKFLFSLPHTFHIIKEF